MPHETRVVYTGVVQHGIPNFGELREKAGYYAAWSGKWHVGDMYPALRQPWTKRSW